MINSGVNIMKTVFRIRVLFLLLSIVYSFSVLAQAELGESGVVYLGHFEVDYSSEVSAVEIIKEYAKEAKEASGNSQFEVLQNVYRSDQFAIIEAWQDQQSREAFLGSPVANDFRTKLVPMLTAAYDERQQGVLDYESDAGTNTDPQEDALYLLTHVDIGRQGTAKAEGLLKSVAADARAQDGNTRFNVYIQTTRSNHFTVVEVWNSQQFYLTHSETESFKSFRHEVQPMMGSLYDERMYSLIQ